MHRRADNRRYSFYFNIQLSNNNKKNAYIYLYIVRHKTEGKKMNKVIYCSQGDLYCFTTMITAKNYR